MGDLIEHPGSNTGALIAQDPEAVARLREQRLQEVRHETVWQQPSCAAVCCEQSKLLQPMLPQLLLLLPCLNNVNATVLQAQVLEEKLRQINEELPTKIHNVVGSCAGAGSGDFHYYRQVRDALLNAVLGVRVACRRFCCCTGPPNVFACVCGAYSPGGQQ